MTVLITGGAGYVGSHVAYEMVDTGHETIVVDNLSTGYRSSVPKQARLIVGNVGDRDFVRRVIADYAIQSIIHTAGSTIIPESISNPLKYYNDNTLTSSALIEAAIAGGVRQFVFSSTAAVYGGANTTAVTEDADLNPTSPYGRSKLMAELILQDASVAHGLKYAILRYFNVAGADPLLRTGQSTISSTHLIKVAVQTALGQRPSLDVFGTNYSTPDGTCIRDYIHVSDLARAHVDVLRYLEHNDRSITLNCGYGRGYSVLEVIDAVKRVSGVNFPVCIAPARRGDLARVIAAPERARTQLGWVPRHNNLDTIVAHALAWDRKLMRTR